MGLMKLVKDIFIEKFLKIMKAQHMLQLSIIEKAIIKRQSKFLQNLDQLLFYLFLKHKRQLFIL